MPDRAKEALFSMLGSYYDSPGGLPPLCVADVFAGSGSMGLEALSRGAASCCFFERDREALEALRRNLEVLGVNRQATVVTRDGWRAAVCAPDGRPFEMILLDPPYRDSLDTSEEGAVRRYLARLCERDDNRPLVVLHHPAKIGFMMQDDDAWRIVDQRSFGTSAITLFER